MAHKEILHLSLRDSFTAFKPNKSKTDSDFVPPIQDLLSGWSLLFHATER